MGLPPSGLPPQAIPKPPAVGPMSEPFDPYRKWLGIPPKDQPPNHYRLLGIANFETDPDVIDNAATRQMAHVRTFKNSKHAALSQRILTELSAARLCLLTPEQKQTYDTWLRGQLAASGRLSDSMVLGATPALAIPPPVPMPAPTMPVPALPPFGVRGDDRWRTEDDSEPSAASPPPVPIPMPVGTAVAPVPMIRRRSAGALRARRERSALPVALTIISLVVLAGAAGVAALVFGGVLGTDPSSRPKTKAVEKNAPPPRIEKSERPKSRASSTDNAAAGKSAAETPFPIGIATSGSSKSSVIPPKTTPPKTTPPPPANAVPAIDRVRQALFQATDGLENRDDDKFVRHITLAEKDIASAGIEESELGPLKEQAQHLRNIQQLSTQFWQTVNGNLQNQLPIGEKFKFLANELTVTAREADVVELSLNGKTHKNTIRELDPIAAALIAARTAKITEPATFLPIVAFLSIDGRAMREYPEDNAVKFSRNFFHENKLAGEKNLEIAAKLGLKLAELPLDGAKPE